MEGSWYNDEGGAISFKVDNENSIVLLSGTEYYTETVPCDDINIVISKENDEYSILDKIKKDGNIESISLSFYSYGLDDGGDYNVYINSVNGKKIENTESEVILSKFNLYGENMLFIMESCDDSFDRETY